MEDQESLITQQLQDIVIPSTRFSETGNTANNTDAGEQVEQACTNITEITTA